MVEEYVQFKRKARTITDRCKELQRNAEGSDVWGVSSPTSTLEVLCRQYVNHIDQYDAQQASHDDYKFARKFRRIGFGLTALAAYTFWEEPVVAALLSGITANYTLQIHRKIKDHTSSNPKADRPPRALALVRTLVREYDTIVAQSKIVEEAIQSLPSSRYYGFAQGSLLRHIQEIQSTSVETQPRMNDTKSMFVPQGAENSIPYL